jgi:hypothetical protein
MVFLARSLTVAALFGYNLGLKESMVLTRILIARDMV